MPNDEQKELNEILFNGEICKKNIRKLGVTWAAKEMKRLFPNLTHEQVLARFKEIKKGM